MAKVAGRFFGVEIAEALSLDPRQVMSMTIVIPVDGIVLVNVGLAPTPEQAEQISQVFKQYKLCDGETLLEVPRLQ